MVGTIAGLQLRLYVRGLRHRSGAAVLLLLGAIYAVGILSGALSLVLGLHDRPVSQRADVFTGAMALLIALRLLTAVFAGQEQSLDPARFALLPVGAGRLQPGLLVAAFCTPGPWFLVGMVLVGAQLFRDRPGLLVLALALGLVGLVVSTLLDKVVVEALSRVLHARRFRDVLTVVVMLVAMASGVAVQGATRAVEREGLDRIGGLSGWLAWTPLGWPFAGVRDVAGDRWDLFGVHVALDLLLAAVLWWLWGVLLARSLTSPLETGGRSASVRTGSLADRITPSGAAGAIAARTLRYYRRDPRHVMQLMMMVMLPVLCVAPQFFDSSSGGVGSFGRGALLLPAFVGVLIGSSTLSQEISLDGSALWHELVVPVSGRADRWGRLYAFLLVAVPVLLVIDVAFALLTHGVSNLVAILGGSLAGLGAGSAVGCVLGAVVQTAQPPPGSSPFARTSSGGLEASVLSFVGIIVAAALSAPFMLLGWHAWGSVGRSVLLLVLALTVHPLLLWCACGWGGRILDRKWPEVLQRVTWNN